jgi:hypothetical protein
VQELISSAMSIMVKYKLAMLYVTWCLIGIFVSPHFKNTIILQNLPLLMELFIGLILELVIFVVPFYLGTAEFNKIGKKLTVENSLYLTLIKISPLVIVYFLIILLIWHPKNEGLLPALNHVVKNPDWWKLGFFTIIIYYIVRHTAVEPYKNVTSALLGLLAFWHIKEIYHWYRLDDGCRTDHGGYTDCDDSYIRIMDQKIEEAALLNLNYESFIAAELYFVLFYSLLCYVFLSSVKVKFFR